MDKTAITESHLDTIFTDVFAKNEKPNRIRQITSVQLAQSVPCTTSERMRIDGKDFWICPDCANKMLKKIAKFARRRFRI